MKHLTLNPYIPMGFWLTLAVAGIVLLAFYGFAVRRRLPRGRRVAVIVLMSVALAVPLAILLNPTWVERIPPPSGKPLLTVLVDRSASMAVADEDDGKTPRYAAASRIARQMSGQLDDRYEVRVRGFAADSSPIQAEEMAATSAEGRSTDLAAAIEAALDEDRPQGQAILLLSDGAHNASGGAARVREVAAKAKATAAPVFVKTLGGQAGVRDLDVSLDMPEKLAFIGQTIPVVVHLRQRGALARRVRLSLLCDGEVVGRRDVEVFPDGETEAKFEITREEVGLYRYELSADELPGEVTGVNNTATLLLRTIDRPVRVLLLEGKPYWDTKFLIRTLTADSLIELVSVVRLADDRFLQRRISRASKEAKQGKKGEAEKGKSEKGNVEADEWTVRSEAGQILAEPGALDSYQIVVLGRDSEVYLTDGALAQLEKWLGEGDGSLVCFRGAPAARINQRLAALMPVRWAPSTESRFQMRWTQSGNALRWLPEVGDEEVVSADMPTLATVAAPQSPRPLAVVLATGSIGNDERTAVLSYQRVGTGRVVVVEGAGMWRWAFLPPRKQQHDGLYGRLWRSLVRWLVSDVGLLPGQRFALKTDKVTFSTQESVAAELLVRREETDAEPPKVQLLGKALKEPMPPLAPVPSGDYPGQFRVKFGRLPQGRYTAKVIGAKGDEISAVTAFEVRGNLKEQLEVQARPDLMKMVAQQSGGSVLKRVKAGDITQQFERHLDQTRPERIKRTTAWDRWWVLTAALVLWGVTWKTRRRCGLV